MFRFLATKRFWKRLAIVTGAVLLLLIVVVGSFAWWVNHRWEAKLAEIRAAGQPTSIAELAPAPIPDDQNAAAVLERITPQLEAFRKDQWKFWGSPMDEEMEQQEKRGQPPTPEQIEAIRQIVNRYPEIDRALAEAAACDRYASRLDFSLGPSEFIDGMIDRAPNFRTAARFQVWRMLVLTADGRLDGATLRGIDLLKLAKLYESEPTLVQFLVSVAVRGMAVQSLYDTLAAGDVSPEMHATLDKELVFHDDPQRMGRALQTERAFAVSSVLRGRLCQGELCKKGNNPLEILPVMKWYGVGVLDAFEELIVRADRPWYEVYSYGGSPEKETIGHGVLADLFVPTVWATHTAEARTTAALRALRIFNVLTQYGDDHGGQASGLEDLSLPKEATIDPFSGEPLKLKLTDDGWVIYSVYLDGVDDGGDFNDMKDCGLAPRGHRGD